MVATEQHRTWQKNSESSWFYRTADHVTGVVWTSDGEYGWQTFDPDTDQFVTSGVRTTLEKAQDAVVAAHVIFAR